MGMFPFAGIGGLTAVTFLVLSYAIFAGLVRLLGAAASGVRSTVVPGIVDGLRDWSRPEDDHAPASPTTVSSPWEDLPSGAQLGAE